MAKNSYPPRTRAARDSTDNYSGRLGNFLIIMAIVVVIGLILAWVFTVWLESLNNEAPATFNGCTYHTIPEYCQCRGMIYDEDSGNCVTEDGKYWCSFWPGDSAIYENECGCNE